ncbi:MAG: SufE family protein [Pseudomonadota bacterium]
MTTIDDTESELIDEFQLLDGWMDRYQYLIDLGRRLPELDVADKLDENRLAGCQSQVWLASEYRDGRVHFRAASDAAIVSGLIALLMRIYDERTPAEIIATEPRFVRELAFDEHLSPTRSNGLAAMLAAIKQHAAGYLNAPAA